MYSHESAKKGGAEKAARSPRRSGPALPGRSQGLPGLQRAVGNAAVVQLLGQSGHSWAKPEEHQHSAGCGHRGESPAPPPPRSAPARDRAGGGSGVGCHRSCRRVHRASAEFGDYIGGDVLVRLGRTRRSRESAQRGGAVRTGVESPGGSATSGSVRRNAGGEEAGTGGDRRRRRGDGWSDRPGRERHPAPLEAVSPQTYPKLLDARNEALRQAADDFRVRSQERMIEQMKDEFGTFQCRVNEILGQRLGVRLNGVCLSACRWSSPMRTVKFCARGSARRRAAGPAPANERGRGLPGPRGPRRRRRLWR
ncbi:hypothetical protein SAMN05216499_13848 [Actinacidiphila paucisporea]|uniref:Uncharacterized protein n=1 Tax=Actinacidiphila paucisporea TaxID=310782 RepID=A0A1M7QN58_9ACTN|nr:hypothetical protein SAMN05216499_13848 [Actinacidiphila paucisporea]